MNENNWHKVRNKTEVDKTKIRSIWLAVAIIAISTIAIITMGISSRGNGSKFAKYTEKGLIQIIEEEGRAWGLAINQRMDWAKANRTDLLEADTDFYYRTKRILSATEQFLSKYPNSTYRPQAESIQENVIKMSRTNLDEIRRFEKELFNR